MLWNLNWFCALNKKVQTSNWKLMEFSILRLVKWRWLKEWLRVWLGSEPTSLVFKRVCQEFLFSVAQIKQCAYSSNEMLRFHLMRCEKFQKDMLEIRKLYFVHLEDFSGYVITLIRVIIVNVYRNQNSWRVAWHRSTWSTVIVLDFFLKSFFHIKQSLV